MKKIVKIIQMISMMEEKNFKQMRDTNLTQEFKHLRECLTII